MFRFGRDINTVGDERVRRHINNSLVTECEEAVWGEQASFFGFVPEECIGEVRAGCFYILC